MLFGLLRIEKEYILKRFVFSNEVDDYINRLFDNQEDEFYHFRNEDLEVKDFCITYASSNEFISRLPFNISGDFISQAKSPASLDVIDPQDDLTKLVALVKISSTNQSRFLFQLVEKKRVIYPNSFWMFSSGAELAKCLTNHVASSLGKKAFSFTGDAGLQAGDKITMIYDGKWVYFKSYYQANRIFPLNQELKEATHDEMMVFLQMGCFTQLEDKEKESIIGSLNQNQRKLVAQAIALGYVGRYSVDVIANKYQDTGNELEIVDGRFVFPSGSAERTRFLKFLAEFYTKSLFDDSSVYEIGGKRPVS